MTLDEYFGGWIRMIDIKELNKVTSIVGNMKVPICPNISDVFKAFRLCPYEDLKIVMIGQDPYPQKGVATGIAFANKKEVDSNNLSPSLNIIKEAAINFEIPHNNIIFDQTLESWAKQGILMLNSALTVEIGKVGSHTMLWRPFITKLLKNLSYSNTGLIYVLFGEQAKTFTPYIDRRFNIIIEEKHPAYYARIEKKMPSTIFTNISKITKEKYKEPIKWFEN